MLSGFVTSYAYDDRWNTNTFKGFWKRKFIRLYPLRMLATVFGACIFYLEDCEDFPLIKSTSYLKLFFITIWALTLIPGPQCFDIRGWGLLNPFNGPDCTILYECIGCFLYSTIFRRMSEIVLIFCDIVFCVLSILLCFNVDTFGFLKNRKNEFYHVNAGWVLNYEHESIALTRLLFPFVTGLLMAKKKFIINIKYGYLISNILLFIVLVLPWCGTEDKKWLNGLYELFVVIIIFPFVVSISAGSKIKGKNIILINKFLGEISYPINILRHPLIFLQEAFIFNYPDASFSHHFLVSIIIFVFSMTNTNYICILF